MTLITTRFNCSIVAFDFSNTISDNEADVSVKSCEFMRTFQHVFLNALIKEKHCVQKNMKISVIACDAGHLLCRIFVFNDLELHAGNNACTYTSYIASNLMARERATSKLPCVVGNAAVSYGRIIIMAAVRILITTISKLPISCYPKLYRDAIRQQTRTQLLQFYSAFCDASNVPATIRTSLLSGM